MVMHKELLTKHSLYWVVTVRCCSQQWAASIVREISAETQNETVLIAYSADSPIGVKSDTLLSLTRSRSNITDPSFALS